MRRDPCITSLFISLNFYADRPQVQISDYTAVYLNSWGDVPSLGPACASLANLEAAEQRIRAELEIKDFPDNTVFYFSRGAARQG